MKGRKKLESKEEILEENIENEIIEEEMNEKSLVQQELEETTDRLKRVMAEFENYKKREIKEREMIYKTILADIVNSLLPVIDNLEHAMNTRNRRWRV